MHYYLGKIYSSNMGPKVLIAWIMAFWLLAKILPIFVHTVYIIRTYILYKVFCILYTICTIFYTIYI
jgi:hypothetical protein